MGKSSSSSLKKKRSKISSSQARIKKRCKSRTRRNNKSKKLRSRDDSVSYSSDSDDSRSSVSVSSSSSEDDYRSRRSRSRTRKDVKGSKKRTRRQSSSDERTEDTPRLKKRKGSKRSDDFQVRKKTYEKKKNKNNKKKRKKKSKRKASVSSTNSGSWSCSTCRGGSTSSYEGEVEKNRGRSERKDKDWRRVEKAKSGTKRRSRLRSCSSCSLYSDYRSDDEQLTGEVNLRRLRSVITVTREANEERAVDKDEHKEEMVYDHDDYPSSRSNDSNDGGSKRELVHNSCVASDKKKHEEDEKKVDASNVRSGKVIETDEDSEGYDGSNPNEGIGMNDAVKGKRNEDSAVVDSPNAYDLESILRQKALENLRTFRSGHQTDAKAPVNQKDLIDSDVKRLSTTKAELFQNKFPKEGGARAVVTSQLAEENSIPAGSTEFLQNDKHISDGNTGGKDYGAKHDVSHPLDSVALTSNPNESVNVTFGSKSYKPRLISLASRRELSKASTNKQVPTLQQEPTQAKSMTGSSVADSMVETAQTVMPLIGRSNGEEVNNSCSSTSDDPSSYSKSISAVISSNKPQDEAKEDSQFEQKTMTVMRGGEMVEVSYKVYIPKKAPALSRRPLKR